MTKRHTPGPWIPAGPCFDGTKPKWFSTVVTEYEPEDGEDTICELSDWIGARQEQNANAHLIAAAPELLEALVSIQAWVTDGGFEDTHEGVAEICGQVRAAIDKAYGEDV